MNPSEQSAPAELCDEREDHPVAAIDSYVTGGLDPNGRHRIEEHLDTCLNCRRYTEQLAMTVELLAQRRLTQPPAGIGATDDRSPTAAAFREHGPRLVALARAIDPPHGEDVVQDVWLDTVEKRTMGLTVSELANKVASLAGDHADRDRRDVAASALEEEWQQRQEEISPPDRDADYAEVFLPDLYQQDQDGLGRWLTSVNEWPGASLNAAPESRYESKELLEVVDNALAELPVRSQDLLAGADLDGIDVAALARASHRSRQSVEAELAMARDHVRAQLDAYLAN